MRVDFVDSQKAEHGVQPVLQALEDTPAQIAPSTYYAAKTRPASARSRRDEELTAMIEQVHAADYGVYGARKIWHELHRQGVPVARCTVEQLMREVVAAPKPGPGAPEASGVAAVQGGTGRTCRSWSVAAGCP